MDFSYYKILGPDICSLICGCEGEYVPCGFTNYMGCQKYIGQLLLASKVTKIETLLRVGDVSKRRHWESGPDVICEILYNKKVWGRERQPYGLVV